MRIGLLSDIHGNAAALEAVLEHASGRHVDQWLNLGDTYYGPLGPVGTLALLESIEVLTVLGNQDRLLLERSNDDATSSATLAHVLSELGETTISRLQALPSSLSLEIGVFVCHGTPSSDTDYLLEDVAWGHPTVKADADLTQALSDVRADVIVCGHTHIPRVVLLRNELLIVNPGSVGLPAYSSDAPNYHRMETFSPNASYATIEKQDDRWISEQYSIPYDYERAVRQALRVGRSDWAAWSGSGRC